MPARTFALFAAFCFVPLAAPAAERPNVLIVITDDQGWGDLACHGNADARTPNLDALAASGASFENFYVCPVCSPTRCELLTGRYHRRCGVFGVSEGGERLNSDERTLADHFAAAGYRTALFGKWHNGTQHPYHPLDRGFQTFYGFTSGHWGHYFSPRLDHDGRSVEGRGYLSDDFTDHAIEFCAARQDEPFLAVLAYNSPHSPMQVPRPWWERFDDEPLAMHGTNAKAEDAMHTRAALAMVANLDWNVGRLLESLEAAGRLRDTYVVFLSDNGPNGHRFNGGMRGVKGSVDEGGVRSPLFISRPGTVPAGGVVRQLSGAVDLYPTLAEMCGLEAAPTGELDGVSLADAVLGKDLNERPRTLWSAWNNKHAIRDGRYCFVAPDQLYDVRADREQRRDLAKDLPEVVGRLKAELDRLKAECPPPPRGRPFTVGYRLDLPDQLPARDATLMGGLKRSSKHPNCSFVTDWTSAGDGIQWPIEVAEAGEYEAEIHYNCPPEDLGTRLTLSAGGGEVLEFRWPAAATSPLIGAAEDRVPRDESYWKEFAVAVVGRIELPAGRQTLSLRAVEIPGRTAGEVGLLSLRRVGGGAVTD